MSNDEQSRGSPDDQYIYVNDGDELRHWSRVLEVTPDKLKEAVRNVGPIAQQVREYLKGTGPAP